MALIHNQHHHSARDMERQTWKEWLVNDAIEGIREEVIVENGGTPVPHSSPETAGSPELPLHQQILDRGRTLKEVRDSIWRLAA